MKIILDENDIKRILGNHLECDPDKITIVAMNSGQQGFDVQACVEANNVRVED